MAKINRFEEIHSWRLARELVKEIYRLTNQGHFARDYGFRDQIRRAAHDFISAKEKCEIISKQIWNFMKYLKENKG